VPDEDVPDGNPSPIDIEEGERMAGHFARLSDRDNFDEVTLERTGQRMDAMDFVPSRTRPTTPTARNDLLRRDRRRQQETTHGRIDKLRSTPRTRRDRVYPWCSTRRRGRHLQLRQPGHLR
jgi:hypothetical protein